MSWDSLRRIVAMALVSAFPAHRISAQNAVVSTPSSMKDEPALVPLATLLGAPAMMLTNGSLSVKVYLPDSHHGFYRGTRFDWAGVVGSLIFQGHDFYMPWFTAMSPGVRDFAFQGSDVVASSNTAATGPAEEFNGEGGALGFTEARAGETFVKIGVGVLLRPDDAAYSAFRIYPLIDAGKRTTVARAGRIIFTHTIALPRLGYAYHYTKTIRLEPNRPVLLIEHILRNTGKKTISTAVYNHNFLNIDGGGTPAGLEARTTFPITLDRPVDAAVAGVEGNRFFYRVAPPGTDRISAKLAGFGNLAADNDFYIVDRFRNIGVRITGDLPLSQLVLWSIRPVMAIEPFVHLAIRPGETARWSYRYEYFSGDHPSG